MKHALDQSRRFVEQIRMGARHDMSRVESVEFGLVVADDLFEERAIVRPVFCARKAPPVAAGVWFFGNGKWKLERDNLRHGKGEPLSSATTTPRAQPEKE